MTALNVLNISLIAVLFVAALSVHADGVDAAKLEPFAQPR